MVDVVTGAEVVVTLVYGAAKAPAAKAAMRMEAECITVDWLFDW